MCSDIAGSQGLLAGVRVLVVEDDESCRIAFARLLAVEGAAVATAASAREGLDVFREVRPHVVISDLILPDEDGCWLIRRILAVAGERPRTIVVTSVMHPSEQTRCFAAGFEVFLLKPVEPRLLCGLVARLAREPRPGAGGPADPGRP